MKKIIILLLILCFSMCFIGINLIVQPVEAGVTNAFANGLAPSSQQQIMTNGAWGAGQSFAGNNGYLLSATFYLKKSVNPQSGTVTAVLYQQPSGNNNPSSNSPIIETSSTSYTINLASTSTWGAVTFQFAGTTYLNSSFYWTVALYTPSGVTDWLNVGISGNGAYVIVNNGGTTFSTGTSYSISGWVITSDTLPTPAPTQAPPEGSVKVNFMVNNSLSSNQYGNITWTALQEGIITINYVNAMARISQYFKDGLSIQLKPQLATGWYFWNYTLINDDGTTVYPIDLYALTLDSSKGTYNISMGISQTPNTVNITLVDTSLGTIYFQNFFDGQFQGYAYGAGSYQIQYGHQIKIATMPDSGYITDYYTLNSNGVNSIASGESIDIVCLSNTTITPHYVKDDASGVTDGSGSFLNFWSTLTWQNIAVIIIYAICCGLCTYAFAFTGLIAGLDIATAICFLTGLLGDLMYPVLGLIIICNIALIIVGSGLLNRKKNGADA